MALRSDHGVDALRRCDGLQRFRRNRAKRKWQSVLLRNQTRRVGGDWLRGDVADHAVQLSTTEKPASCLRPVNRCYDHTLRRIWFQQCQRRASLVEVPLVFGSTLRIVQTGPADFSRLLSREKSRRRRRFLAHLHTLRDGRWLAGGA